jgi:hypothetical protein
MHLRLRAVLAMALLATSLLATALPGEADPTRRPLKAHTPTPACSDGADNDGDTLIDLQDPGCSSASDNSERNH